MPANNSPPKLKKKLGQLKPGFHLYLSSLVPTCDAANVNAEANDVVHTSNANSRKARYAGAVKDSQTFSRIADEGNALAAISLLFAAVPKYRVLKGRKNYLFNAIKNVSLYTVNRLKSITVFAVYIFYLKTYGFLIQFFRHIFQASVFFNLSAQHLS